MFPGNPSARDLEQLFSLGSLAPPGPTAHGSDRPRTKRGSSSRSEKRKSGGERRRSLSDSPHAHTHRKDNLSRAPRVREPGPAEASGEEEAELRRPEVVMETVGVKLHRLESRKFLRRDTTAAASEQETASRGRRDIDHEQEERRRKRRSEEVAVTVASAATDGGGGVKNKLMSKHLEKTVSIRLVDIRNSDSDDYFFDEGLTKRSSASLDAAAANTKFNKGGVALDAAVKANGWLRKPHNAAANGHVKGWGKFRIPKRSERPDGEEVEPRKPLLRPLTNTPTEPPPSSPTPSPSYPRTRLRTGSENDSSGGGGGDSDVEPCLKRCHSHQLRGDASLGRRYGSDIIRRGVLAS